MSSRAPNTCNYHGPKGLCARRCWRERCSQHQKAIREYTPCARCGILTRSKHNLCKEHSGSARVLDSRMRRKAHEEMNIFIDSLLDATPV